MSPYKVQPWGKPTTPLLPKSLAESLKHMPLPSSLRRVLGPDATIAILNGSLWDRVNSVDKDSLYQIINMVRPLLRSYQHLPIRSGEPLSVPIESLPFSRRTSNIVRLNLNLFSSPYLTFEDILQVNMLGVRSAIEFACVLEAAILNMSNTEQTGVPSQSNSHTIPIPNEIISAFQSLAAYAAGEEGHSTLANVLPEAEEDWPPEIKMLWNKIGEIDSQQLAGDIINRYSAPLIISRALESIDNRLSEILTKRVLAIDNVMTLELLGKSWSVTRERVRQIEKQAISYLQQFKSDDFGPIIRKAKRLRERLGIGVPVNDQLINNALASVTGDLDYISDINLVNSLLLWLAGPYKIYDGWLLAKKDLPRLTLEAILDRRDDRGIITNDDVISVLEEFNFNKSSHSAWVKYLGNFVVVDDGYIYLRGSIPDQALALIRYYDRPLTADEIVDMIGKGNVRGIRQRLIEDPRFWRINKQSQFIIANTPGYDEYTGISDEIIQELEACGGEAPLHHLVEKIARVYGVKENSVIAHLSTPLFTKDDDNIIRVRNKDDDINISTDISKTAACYKNPKGFWYCRVVINKDIARGSGYRAPNAFAQILGCGVGDKIEVESECGPLKVSWPLSSTAGATFGSLRSIVEHYGLGIGDYLFIKATEPRILFSHLKKEVLNKIDSEMIRLSLLLGCDHPTNDSEAIKKIGAALDIADTSSEGICLESRRLLRKRGESELADMLPAPKLSIDEQISRMQRLFDRS